MRAKLFLVLLFGIFLIGFVSASVSTNGSTGTCTDTDEGNDIYNGGMVNFKSPPGTNPQFPNGIFYYDYCSDNENLYEYFCKEDGSFDSVAVDCPSGYLCYDDKCIRNDESPSSGGSGGPDTAPSSGGGGGSGIVNSSNNTQGGGSGSYGGNGSSSSCVRYYICPDGTQVNYCSITSSNNGGGCGCSNNPSSLCPTPSTSGGGGLGVTNNSNVSPSEGGGGGAGGISTCDSGCLLNSTCTPLGYRTRSDYCDIGGNFTQVKSTDSQCNNNFECASNFCLSSQCINPNLIQRIVAWFQNLFG